MARLSLLCVSDRPNAYTSQKKGAVSERVLDLVDTDKTEGVVIPDASQDEHRDFPEDSLTGKRIEFAVGGFPQFGGRTILRGKTVSDQFPGKTRDLTKSGKRLPPRCSRIPGASGRRSMPPTRHAEVPPPAGRRRTCRIRSAEHVFPAC